MALRYYANAPATTLAVSVTDVATSMQVASTTGLPVSYPYTLILDRGTGVEEAVEVTAAAGTTLTVTRGVDGTTAFAHTSGAEVVHGITARDIREANTHINSTSGVHGTTGDLVATSDTQSLTNKDLSSGTNTFPDSIVGFTIPTGAGLEWFTDTAPTGFLMQDGSVVSRTTYADLFAVIGTTFNTGGEPGTDFRLPNKNGRVGVGKDAGQAEFNVLGETGGAKTHQLNESEMPYHGHSVIDPGHSHPFDGSTQAYQAGVAGGLHFGQVITNPGYGTHIYYATTGIQIGMTGGGNHHNNLQPYLVQRYIIKT